MKPSKIISGAQTGADRAALDAAIEVGVTVGGWVPKGRRAEDGTIADKYPNLEETDSEHYESRSRYNVRDADATLIVSHGDLHGGSRYTRKTAQQLGKPWLHVDLDESSIEQAVKDICDWLEDIEGGTLNVAGPRASSDRKIYKATKKIVAAVLRGGD